MSFKILYLSFAVLVLRSGCNTQVCTAHDGQSCVSGTNGWLDLIAWIKSNGGFVHSSLRIDEVFHGGMSVRGLLTDKELPSGTVLFRVPKRLWLTQSSLSSLAVCREISGLALEKLRLAITILIESKKNHSSFYAPFLRNALEHDGFNHLPFSAKDAVRTDFFALPMFHTLMKGSRSWHERTSGCFERLQQEADSPLAKISKAELQAAILTVETYAISFNSDGGGIVFIPGLSSLNTEYNAAVNSEWHPTDEACEIVTMKAVPAGGELLANYCGEHCDNERLVSQWGVYFEENSNRLNGLGEVDCAESTPMHAAAQAMLDLGNAQSALESGWTAPRCLDSERESSDQGSLRCMLARLAWESCAASWGHGAWKARDTSSLARARLEHSISHKNIAMKHEDDGDLQRAAESYQTALALSPEAGSYAHLGIILEKMQDFKGAIQNYQAAIRMNPSLTAAHLRLAASLEESNDIKGAEKSLTSAVHLDPKSAHVQSQFGSFLARQSNFDHAKKRFLAAVKLDPTNVQYRKLLAKHLQDQEDLKGAEKAWRTVVKLDPRDPEAQNNLGQVLAHGGDLASGGKRFQAAIAINPADAAYHHNLGIIMQHTRTSAEAEKCFRRALSIEPLNANVQRDLEQLLASQKGRSTRKRRAGGYA